MVAVTQSNENNQIKQAAQAWGIYVNSKHALLEAGLIRSYRAPEADFAEWLVAYFLRGVTPKSKSQAGYDVIVGNKRIQVKSISKMPNNPNGYIIQKKDRHNNRETAATHYIFVFFNELIPDAIFLVEESFVREFGKKQIKRPDLESENCQLAIDLSIFRQVFS